MNKRTDKMSSDHEYYKENSESLERALGGHFHKGSHRGPI